jgi:hypothetical protein
MRQAAAIPEKEEDYRNWHRRVEVGTAITSGKKRPNLQDPQENPGGGDREANCRISYWITKHRTLDLVEGSTPSKTKKERETE